jgi:hypothetical protein
MEPINLQDEITNLSNMVDDPSDFVQQAARVKDLFPASDVNQIVSDMGLPGFDLDNTLAKLDITGDISLPPIDLNKFTSFNPEIDVLNTKINELGETIQRGIKTFIPSTGGGEPIPDITMIVGEFIKPEVINTTPFTATSNAFNFVLAEIP